MVIPGINNGEDVDNSIVREKPGYAHTFDLNNEDCTLFNHPNIYSGQNRKYVGDAPDIGAYEYGDSVYWIPGFRYPHPSLPIPNDGAVEVPIDYSLVWNYPYNKDYSNTKAIVTVTGPGMNLTKEFQYPHNVFSRPSSQVEPITGMSPSTMSAVAIGVSRWLIKSIL